MRKKLVLVMAAMAISTAAAGCAKHEKIATPVAETTEAAESSDAAKTEAEAEGMANPWTTSDREGVLAATGFDMEAPEGATDVVYSYMEDDMLAQMDYTLDGMVFIYRMQFANEFTDISGMYYTWDAEEDGVVTNREAKYYNYVGSETEDGVQVVNWYDAVPGVMYSLSVTGSDLDGMDIQAYAESLFVPLQGEVDGDADGEAEGEAAAVEGETVEETAAESAN